MASYKCNKCEVVREFASAYPTIYCQEIGCDGMCKRQEPKP